MDVLLASIVTWTSNVLGSYSNVSGLLAEFNDLVGHHWSLRYDVAVLLRYVFYIHYNRNYTLINSNSIVSIEK